MADEITRPHMIDLTPREMEVLALIRNGLRSKEIAHALSCTVNTVFAHRRNILKKTGTHSMWAAVATLDGQTVPAK